MNTWRVTARLSLVPAKKILFREMPHALASLLMKRFVSQLVRVMLAAVKRPRGSKLMFVEISSTLKSATRALERHQFLVNQLHIQLNQLHWQDYPQRTCITHLKVLVRRNPLGYVQ